MSDGQLSIFKQKSVGKGAVSRQLAPATALTGESSIMQTLTAYQAHLSQRYAPKTVRMYWGDVRELSLYLRDKQLQEIRPPDLEEWLATLTSTSGRNLERKTLNRKVSAIINYFVWLKGLEVIPTDPTTGL